MHLCERIPWHEALYFVTTTLTTVGYGDMVPTTTVGKLAVLAMICVGVVVIPVQTSQVYSQLTARRVTLGAPMKCCVEGIVCSLDLGRHGSEVWPLAGQTVATGSGCLEMHLKMGAALGAVGTAAAAAIFCRPLYLQPGSLFRKMFRTQAVHRVLGPAGALPDRRMPTVLVSTLLTEVRGFSDFCAEFFKVSSCLWHFSPSCITHFPNAQRTMLHLSLLHIAETLLGTTLLEHMSRPCCLATDLSPCSSTVLHRLHLLHLAGL